MTGVLKVVKDTSEALTGKAKMESGMALGCKEYWKDDMYHRNLILDGYFDKMDEMYTGT